MAEDFVTLLGSRALVPSEVTSRLGAEGYVEYLLGPESDAESGVDVDAVVSAAVAGRRLDPARMRALLVAVAAAPFAELNYAWLAVATGVPRTTLQPYLDALVDAGVLRLLPGCRAAVAKRAIGRPRILLTDLSLVLDLGAQRWDHLTTFAGRRQLAPLLVNAVAGELLRGQDAAVGRYRVSHLRERNGLEVPIVIDLPDDTIYGIEVITAAAVRPRQFARLEALARRAGPRFRGGVVLNTAVRGHRYGHRMVSLPIEAVWTT